MEIPTYVSTPNQDAPNWLEDGEWSMEVPTYISTPNQDGWHMR
jgi:hypothetical protein